MRQPRQRSIFLSDLLDLFLLKVPGTDRRAAIFVRVEKYGPVQR